MIKLFNMKRIFSNIRFDKLGDPTRTDFDQLHGWCYQGCQECPHYASEYKLAYKYHLYHGLLMGKGLYENSYCQTVKRKMNFNTCAEYQMFLIALRLLSPYETKELITKEKENKKCQQKH